MIKRYEKLVETFLMKKVLVLWLLFFIAGCPSPSLPEKQGLTPAVKESLRKSLGTVNVDDGIDSKEAAIVADVYFTLYGHTSCGGLGIPEYQSEFWNIAVAI